LDLGSIRFAQLLTRSVGADALNVLNAFLKPIAVLDPSLNGFALLVGANTVTVLNAFLNPIAVLDPSLNGFALLVGAEALTDMLSFQDFLAVLGALLNGFALGLRITRLAGGLLNLGPVSFLRLDHHRIGVLRTVSGFRTAISNRGRGRDQREHHDEAREERHPFHMDLLSL
jgi:hypothetical protein